MIYTNGCEVDPFNCVHNYYNYVASYVHKLHAGVLILIQKHHLIFTSQSTTVKSLFTKISSKASGDCMNVKQ